MSDPLLSSALLWVVAASGCDLVGNILTRLSDGFAKKHLAVLVMLLQITAFTFLSFALKTIDLGTAYALWGALGIIATTLASRLLFAESLHPVKLLGMAMTLVALVFLKLAI